MGIDAQPTHSDPGRRKHELDSPEWQERLKKLYQWRRQARVAQAENRTQMAIDEDYYDSIQYDAEDLEVLKERNQAPLVYNVIKNTINWILGTELKSKIDYRILPRTKQGAQEAKTKTKLFKYIQDVSQGEFARSKAFADCIIGGLGWLEIAARNNGDEPVFLRSERWRNMWFDHLGMETNCSDWRFVDREKWVDLDISQAMFPEREDDLRVLAEGVNSLFPYLPDDTVITDSASEFDLESDLDSLFGGPFDGNRQRVKLIEFWYRMPANVKLLRMRDEDTPYGALDGTIYRKNQEDHKYLVDGGYFSLTDASILTVRQAIWAGSTYLQDILTPYNHNRFPFVPIFCYRRKRDNMPYGVVRDLRDPQSDLNKRRSRALFLLSANRVIFEKGAVDDKNKALQEVNRPDGMVEVNVGKRFEINKEMVLVNAQVAMSKDDEEFIYKSAGVTRENIGETQKDLSGKAIRSLQEQGQTGTGVLFDNYYFAFQNIGEIKGSLIEQFFDTERQLLVTGDQTKDEFITINERTENGIQNNITKEKSRFIVGKQDFRETIRMAMFQMLSELVQNLAQSMPEVALNLLDLVVEFMDVLPNKDEMVARIRKLNKQSAPEDEMTPEQREEFKKNQEAMAQEQGMAKQIQMAMVQAELALKNATVAEKQNRALKEEIDGKMAKLEGYIKAIEAAGMIAQNPAIVGAADTLIKETEAVPGGNGGAGRALGPRQVQQ